MLAAKSGLFSQDFGERQQFILPLRDNSRHPRPDSARCGQSTNSKTRLPAPRENNSAEQKRRDWLMVIA
jgi:hypothetical protein